MQTLCHNMDSLDRAGQSMVALPMTPCACRGGACLEVQGDPLCSAALRMVLRQAIVEGRQAAPLLVGPGARRIRLQLQGLPQAVVVPVVVGVQRQQLPAGQQDVRLKLQNAVQWSRMQLCCSACAHWKCSRSCIAARIAGLCFGLLVPS